MEKQKQPVDWRTLNCWIEGEPLAIDGLAKSRERLEAIVKPYITTKKTGVIIGYRGKRRFLKPTPAKIRCAAQALQFLCGIEAAMKTGDIDRAVRMAVGYARASADLVDLETWNRTGIDALAADARAKPGKRRGGVNSRKCTAEIKELADNLYSKMKIKSHSGTLNRVAAKLAQEHGIDITAKALDQNGVGKH